VPPARDDGDQHERPDQVVLLLDRERPGVRQRPGAQVDEHVGPVGQVEQRGGDRDLRRQRHRVAQRRQHQRHGQRDHEQQRRQQPQRAAGPERPQVDPPGAVELGEQQGGDEEPADHEEDVDPGEAAVRGGRGVEEDDGTDRERAQPVEGRVPLHKRRR
jgi:hypothetical protein